MTQVIARLGGRDLNWTFVFVLNTQTYTPGLLCLFEVISESEVIYGRFWVCSAGFLVTYFIAPIYFIAFSGLKELFS